MSAILIAASFVIQVVAIIMVLYTFWQVKKDEPKLEAVEEYHRMRNRYERLRNSLLFVVALIAVQLIGLVYYVVFPQGSVTLTQLLISDAIFIALVIFLTGIYKTRDRLKGMDKG